MNISLKSRSLLLSLSVMAAGATVLPAQSVKEIVTDEKYANTTIVYKHANSTATDAEILNQLNSSYGMGDVVRIAVAPPKPAPIAVPKIEKTGSPATIRSVQVSTASTPKAAVALPVATTAPTAQPAAKPQAVTMVEYTPTYRLSPASTLTASTDATADLATRRPLRSTAPAAQQTPRNWVDEMAENSVTQVTQQKATVAPKQVRTHTAAAKSSTKSAKSGSSTSARKKSTPTRKNRKHGSQKYGCFKF